MGEFNLLLGLLAIVSVMLSVAVVWAKSRPRLGEQMDELLEQSRELAHAVDVFEAVEHRDMRILKEQLVVLQGEVEHLMHYMPESDSEGYS